MITSLTPDHIAPPASHYTHGFYIAPGAALMMLSGQLGERPDGTCPDNVNAQARIAWSNALAILDQKGFGIENVVKVISFIVGEENIPGYVEVHREVVGEHRPPWTLVVVPALGRRQYKVEVDITAAG
ncbi:RidA family protein [Stappia sp. BW2]|uniref:RidA family protein n=1 Tax=Stappia sp. BW2 TaxID=2592622 RepID=UPI0011DEA597|nr:RidA family protein [Stappia sp. BW2]TYC75616.1 RidA family protein [Stappia sp. BW2]